ncbi:S8 family serine peptidase [Deinococcus sp. KSM4-11]|uniref:S8 family peptidase n=1 Tax=Deinococcus sp. KSM4-11 TaxID=2568654 RepID=UPI001454CA01|nr:S8 family serine peptidase [Deinococcus sp. KSM4-11]
MKHWLGWMTLGSLLAACTGTGPSPTPVTHPLATQYATLGKSVTVALDWSPQQPQVKVAGTALPSTVQGQSVTFTIPAPTLSADGRATSGGWGGPQPLEITDKRDVGRGTLNVLGRSSTEGAQPDTFVLLSAPGATKDQVSAFTAGLPVKVTLFPLNGPGVCGGFMLVGTYTGKDFEGTLSELDRRAAANAGVVLAVNPVGSWGIGATYAPMNAADEVAAPVARARGWTGKGAVIAVLDTGIGLQSTEEWGSRLLPGHTFTAAGEASGSADDFVGDTRDEDGTLITAGAAQGHGSMVASLAAGSTHGIAPDAEVLPVKVCDTHGQCRTSDVLRGVCWALAYGEANLGGDFKRLILNLSIGGDTGGFEQDVMRVVLQQAIDLGVTVVASAGNQWTDYVRGSLYEPRSYPAALDLGGLIAVGAVRKPADSRSLEVASYSNRGAYVDILAPGSLVSAVDAYGQVRDFNRGTSFAAPQVAGALALWRQKFPTATPAELQRDVQDSADVTRVTVSAEDAAHLTGRLLNLSTLP